MDETNEKLDLKEEIKKIIERLNKDNATHCTKRELIEVLENSK